MKTLRRQSLCCNMEGIHKGFDMFWFLHSVFPALSPLLDPVCLSVDVCDTADCNHLINCCSTSTWASSLHQIVLSPCFLVLILFLWSGPVSCGKCHEIFLIMFYSKIRVNIIKQSWWGLKPCGGRNEKMLDVTVESNPT